MIKFGIRRFETDCLLEGWEKINEYNLGPVKISFYYPYSVIQCTRYCPIVGITKDKRENHGTTKCSRECLKIGDLEIRNDRFVKKIILRGNAQFIKNKDDFLRVTNTKNLDRLVFEPRPPV